MSNYNELLAKDNTREKDIERRSMFYILAHNDDLYSKVHYIYDFKDHSIRFDCLESGFADFSSSSKALLRLAFNLYNGYKDEYSDVMNILFTLDGDNFELAMKAIRIRFRKV